MFPILPRQARAWRLLFIFTFLAVLALLSGCPAAPSPDEGLRREVENLKKEIAALKEQVKKLEAGQQELKALQPAEPASSAAAPAPGETPAPQVVTVSQLIKEKDRYVGGRVTVKGAPGPVLVHHRSVILRAPEGMVEVLLGKLPDQQTAEKLLATMVTTPITVTGTVTLSPRGEPQIQITAEELIF